MNDLPFIYVCTVKDRDKMLAAGYELVGANEETSLWGFLANEELSEELSSELGAYVRSNTMMF